MSKRDSRVIFEEMLSCIVKIERYTEGLMEIEFIGDSLRFDATVRNLEIIGEAANNIPEEVKLQFPEIPWSQLRGLRNRIIHEYFGVDPSIIWFIIHNELAPVKREIQRALNRP